MTGHLIMYLALAAGAVTVGYAIPHLAAEVRYWWMWHRIDRTIEQMREMTDWRNL